MRSVIALAAAAWLLAVGAELALPYLTTPAAHHPHYVSSSTSGHSAEVVDHAHIQDGDKPASHEAFVAAILPRVTTGLAALGVIAALAALVSSFAHLVLPTMRGPPRRIATTLTGQHLVTRFCIARR